MGYPGPPVERVEEQQRNVEFLQFARVVAVLSDNLVRFPRPFDVASSAALGDNTIDGDAAEALFRAMRHRMAAQYRIQVSEVVTGHPDIVEREVVSCLVNADMIAAFLTDVAQQFETP